MARPLPRLFGLALLTNRAGERTRGGSGLLRVWVPAPPSSRVQGPRPRVPARAGCLRWGQHAPGCARRWPGASCGRGSSVLNELHGIRGNIWVLSHTGHISSSRWPLNWTEQTDAFPSLQEVLLGSAGQGRGSGRRQLRRARWAGAGGTFTLRAGPRPHRLRWLHPRRLWAEQLDHHPGPQLPTGHCEQVT